jgi:hypothetical protein
MDTLSSLAVRCEALLAAYRAKGVNPNAELLPGIAAEELRERTRWFPAKVPMPLIELYGWRNGQPNDAWNTKDVFWFRDMQFTCVERARSEYESMMSSYGVGNSRQTQGVDLRDCFPFASFDGGWYVLPCSGQDLARQHPFPVISVFQGIDAYFHSLEAMCETCTAWRLASSQANDVWELPEEEERVIWQRYNPGVLS